MEVTEAKGIREPKKSPHVDWLLRDKHRQGASTSGFDLILVANYRIFKPIGG